MKVPRALAKYVDVVNHPGTYIKAEIDKITQNVKAEVSNAMGKIIVFAMLGVFGLFLLTFASLTLALFLNSVLDSAFYGFLIVTGLYLLVVISLVLIRNNDSLQRKLFGLPKPAKPVRSDAHILPPPDKVDPIKYGVEKPRADSRHPQDSGRRVVVKKTVIRPGEASSETVTNPATEPVRRDPVRTDPVQA